ncbi:hypothetical protein BDV95DRAFT_607397 [Massariosphaeria phaeospora]|uniref:Uncharacterized protein n=1 Tax=Massariosphaeria phaeospora TaxID=100035 RepID=A0A7C8M7I4_9PLEO|nr:hypothetical protein BDV95DRAFT_607397 [Massariosphaeria phaeospora]
MRRGPTPAEVAAQAAAADALKKKELDLFKDAVHCYKSAMDGGRKSTALAQENLSKAQTRHEAAERILPADHPQRQRHQDRIELCESLMTLMTLHTKVVLEHRLRFMERMPPPGGLVKPEGILNYEVYHQANFDDLFKTLQLWNMRGNELYLQIDPLVAGKVPEATKKWLLATAEEARRMMEDIVEQPGESSRRGGGGVEETA